MSPHAESRLLPVLRALDRARKTGDFWNKQYEAVFLKLSMAKDGASREARIALMDYYVGEAYGEGLVCTVALEGPKNIGLLELYENCDISPSNSPVGRFHGSPLRSYALKLIVERTAKKSCAYE